MKHQVKKIKFAHSKSQRMAIMKNLAKDLIKYGHVKTTKTKAKAIVPYVEKMITYVKKNEKSDSFIFSKLSDNDLVKKLQDLSKNKLSKQNSGYFSIYNIGFRKGDGAEMCMVMMNGYEPKVKSDLKKVKKATSAKSKVKAEEVKVETKAGKTKEANK